KRVNQSTPAPTLAVDRIAELEATIIRQQALLDKAKKAEAVQGATTKLIEKPARITNLAEAMELQDRKLLYNHCRASVKTACNQMGILPGIHWHKQDVLRLGELGMGDMNNNDNDRDNGDDSVVIIGDSVEEDDEGGVGAFDDDSPVPHTVMQVDQVNGGKAARKQAGKQAMKRQKTF
ncbi:hypothetical protein AGABI1DRAFT_96112, partial [Agaricus bisporus var. burnettii JB137-S8]